MTTENIRDISCKGQGCMVHMDVAVQWVAAPAACEGSARFESRPGNFPDGFWSGGGGFLETPVRMLGQHLKVSDDYFHFMPSLFVIIDSVTRAPCKASFNSRLSFSNRTGL
jgi:hypothetical protein